MATNEPSSEQTSMWLDYVRRQPLMICEVVVQADGDSALTQELVVFAENTKVTIGDAKQMNLASYALRRFCRSGSLTHVKKFVSGRPDFSETDQCLVGYLHEACFAGHLDVVEYLVCEAGFSPDCGDSLNRTPLAIALEQKHLAVAEFLVATMLAGLYLFNVSACSFEID